MEAVGRAVEEIRRCLEEAKASIKAELRDYPQPITACDAQYNHLAEERRKKAPCIVMGHLCLEGIHPGSESGSMARGWPRVSSLTSIKIASS